VKESRCVLRIDDIEDLDLARQVVQLLEKENARLHTRVELLVRENASLRGEEGQKQLELELLRLQEQMKALQQRMFGASSERRARDAGAGEKQKPTPPDGVREQKSLPLEENTHELPDEDRLCKKCGRSLAECAGKTEDHEEVDVVERRFVLRKHKRKIYGCECGSETVAPGPLTLPGGGRYSIGFAVEVAFEKWCAHSPLERQVRIMLGQGLDISSNTLWEQTERLARVLRPTHLLLREYVVSSCLVHADETPWYLLDKGRSKWWVWSISRHDAVFYRMDPSRAHNVIVEMLEGFEGALVSDGYSAYKAALKALAARGITITLSDCWSHARRGFVEAELSYPECAEAIRLIGELFLNERELPDWEIIEDPVLRAAQLEHIREIRAIRSAPIVEKLRTWANAQQALPQSKLGEALTYLKNQWEGLKVFLSDPRVPLSNNHAERSLRGVVVGRNNHYGSKSKRGTEVAALFYSLLETASMVGVDPKAYLRAAATAALLGHPPLLPHAYKSALGNRA
jgi:transposase